MRFLRDFSGKTLGHLTVLKLVTRKRGAKWLCRCECGNEKVISGHSLRHGTTSCGCRSKASRFNSDQSRTHGESQPRTAEYNSWASMIQRCENEKSPVFSYYGGRGIKICRRWHRYENFLADMGRRPSPQHSIDRFPDKDGDYKKSNCRWATKQEQAENRKEKYKPRCDRGRKRINLGGRRWRYPTDAEQKANRL